MAEIEEHVSDYSFDAKRGKPIQVGNGEIHPTFWGKVIKLIVNGVS